MIKYELLSRNTVPVNYETLYKLSLQWRPVQIDENYFDKLARFGLACLIAAIVGKLVMSLSNQ